MLLFGKKKTKPSEFTKKQLEIIQKSVLQAEEVKTVVSILQHNTNLKHDPFVYLNVCIEMFKCSATRVFEIPLDRTTEFSVQVGYIKYCSYAHNIFVNYLFKFFGSIDPDTAFPENSGAGQTDTQSQSFQMIGEKYNQILHLIMIQFSDIYELSLVNGNQKESVQNYCKNFESAYGDQDIESIFPNSFGFLVKLSEQKTAKKSLLTLEQSKPELNAANVKYLHQISPKLEQIQKNPQKYFDLLRITLLRNELSSDSIESLRHKSKTLTHLAFRQNLNLLELGHQQIII
jgi:hypothetical protein